MKHVFVETNFLIDVARPFRVSNAEKLLARGDRGELALHVPWSCVTEARRTLARIIREDLGFTNNMMRFATRRAPGELDLPAIKHLETLAKEARDRALDHIDRDIDRLVARIRVIPPSPAVIERTLGVFEAKNLKPFDEMALGAVLARATELYHSGERSLYFCSLDADLSPERNARLAQAYAECGLEFLTGFAV